jgi:putative two-component system response regulator
MSGGLSKAVDKVVGEAADGASAARILVVDDEPSLRKIVARWLNGAGYNCATAENATAAWEYLQTHDVPLLTLDINMPGISGVELLPRIKQRWPDTEVIMLTARDEGRLAIDTLTHGAYGYLLKPIEVDELLFHVKKALERRQLQLDKRQYTSTLEARVHEQTAVIRRAHEETILRLMCASQYRDEETGAHIRRTGLFSELFAEVLGWPAEQAEAIRMAAPMHDVGKIGIPDAILQKPGKLTPPEFQIMQTHATIGAAMLDGSDSAVLQMAHAIALCHHERWDGRGYPHGLSGPAIPQSARIVALVDVYDALTHDRVYRRAMSEERALALMEEERETHFDPTLWGVFLTLVPELRRIAAENPDESVPDYARTLPALAASPLGGTFCPVGIPP